MHGGDVTAHSAGVGQGSEFIVRLPLGKQRSSHASPLAPAAASVFPNHRVMVVDDNLDSARSLALLLKKLGAQVQVAHDGPSALDLLAQYHPTVVLLDIGMPGMDGYEVARRIRSQPNGDQFLLIALTGWGQEDDRQRSRQAGFDHHLLKPADLSALKAIVALPSSGPRQVSR
jgi:CheY-like chemotaxis protein